MQIEIVHRHYHEYHIGSELTAQLEPLRALIETLEKKIMSNLDNITREVAETNTVIESAITLIAGLKTQLDAAIAAQQAGDDGVALDALAAQLDTNANRLAAAIAASTVAAPVVTPVVDAPVTETPVVETPVETAPVEETPVVDAPVVEETPVVEEVVAPVVTEEVPAEEVSTEEKPAE